MVKDAEKFAEEDKKKREAVDVKNQVGLLHHPNNCIRCCLSVHRSLARCTLNPKLLPSRGWRIQKERPTCLPSIFKGPFTLLSCYDRQPLLVARISQEAAALHLSLDSC